MKKGWPTKYFRMCIVLQHGTRRHEFKKSLMHFLGDLRFYRKNVLCLLVHR
jgi:hypothetical protein